MGCNISLSLDLGSNYTLCHKKYKIKVLMNYMRSVYGHQTPGFSSAGLDIVGSPGLHVIKPQNDRVETLKIQQHK